MLITRIQNEALKYVYQEYQKGNKACYLRYNTISTDKLAVTSNLRELESNGYIRLNEALGEAHVALTDFGLAYCEETYVKSF